MNQKQTFETPNPTHEQEKGPEELHFLLVDHSPEHTADITRQIAQSDADIVLQELVGSPQDVRDAVEAKINAGIQASTVFKRGAAAQGLPQDLRDLIWALAGSGKEFHFIDVASDSPEYQLATKARQTRMVEPEQYEECFAQSIAARENVVAAQISYHKERNAGKKILVVAGAIHNGLAHRFEGSEISYMEPRLQTKVEARLARAAVA